MDEDQRLVARFCQGEEAAFERLYAKYYDKVLTIAKGIVLDADDAADAAQEVFTTVYRNLKKFDHRSRFSTWLYRVAVNRTIQYFRAGKNKRVGVQIFEHAAIGEDIHDELIGDPNIAVALSRVSPDDRAVLTMFYWEDLSLAELAESLGIGENAAKTRLFRARDRFKKVFETLEK